MRCVKLWLMGLALTCVAPAGAHDNNPIAQARRVAFPKLEDGRAVLAVDLHAHSVLSDGSVWPDIRLEEARRDGLFALAVSEHLEYQPKKADIPHPYRNRSFELARQAAEAGAASGPLLVIAGS